MGNTPITPPSTIPADPQEVLESHKFWRDVFMVSSATSPRITKVVVSFGVIAAAICTVDSLMHRDLGIDATLMEFAGAAIGLLLVLRTNEGYGRWWESRKLWGGIVNQARNLAIEAVAYGPDDQKWRSETIRWTIAFVHSCRRNLRGQRSYPEVARLLGEEEAARLAAFQHPPTYASLRISALLREAADRGMHQGALMRIDQERSQLIDWIGACERVLKTPLPWVYVVQLRRFSALYLATLPLGLITKIGWWPTPFVTMMVAYPIVGLDRIASQLQNPFSTRNLAHLPLDDITTAIENTLLALEAKAAQGEIPTVAQATA